MDPLSKDNQRPDFTELVNQYYTSLYRFAYSLVKNKHDACDLTQQVFFIWAKKGSSLRDASKVKSWLYTTLYREFLRVRRRKSRLTSFLPETMEEETPRVSPVAVDKMDAARAVEAINEINEKYRAPVILFYLKELTYKEIAAALGVPVGTVMSRLSRGKAQLKKIIMKKQKTNLSGITLPFLK